MDWNWTESAELVEKEKQSKAKEAVKKVKKAKEPMSREEIEAKFREILANPKLSKTEKARLQETFIAWRNGEIEPETPKFSKAEALRMYARLAAMKREEKLEKMAKETPDNYILVDNTLALDNVVRWWKDEPLVGLDTETDGLDVLHGENRMVGLSVTFPTVDKHVYIPVRHTTGERQLSVEQVMNAIKPFIEDENKKKVLHNAKFDAHVFFMEGAILRGIFMDTQIAFHILNENEMSFKLKDLANKYAKYLGIKAENDTFSELFGKASFDTVPHNIALVYAAKDTHITYLLAEFICKQFERPHLAGIKKLYFELENPLLIRVIEMEQTGFLLNTPDVIDSAIETLRAEVKEYETFLVKEFGDINFGSPQQLSKVLYDEKGYEDISGKRSTGKDTLKMLADEHPEVGMILKHRKVTKMLGSFFEKLPTLVKSTGRVYGQFMQVGTVTGRFASKEPNLQQIPPHARQIFKAPDGSVIIGSDFSQIEPRVLAHITGDEALQKPYKEGYDLYSTLAAATFKLPIEQCVDGAYDDKGRQPRKMMKTGLLAVMYGTSMFTLSKQLEITVEEANQFINDFYEAYPTVEAWIKSIHESVKENELVETMYGRKRRFPNHKQAAIQYDMLAAQICELTGEKRVPSNIWDKKWKDVIPYPLKRSFQNVKGSVERVRRQAVNAIIQGSAADIMKIAMLNLANVCDKYEGWKMLGSVHDEALLELPDTITKEQTAEIEFAMTSAATLDVPLKVDVAFMPAWGQEIKKDEWFKAA